MSNASVAAIAVVLFAACSSSPSRVSCPTGESANAQDICRQLCIDSDTCPQGQICSDGLCEPGEREESSSVEVVVTNLQGTVIIRETESDEVYSITEDTTLDEILEEGAPYAFVIDTQPDGQICTLSLDDTASPIRIDITCASYYLPRVRVAGSSGETVSVTVNDESLSRSSDGWLDFTTPALENSQLDVSIDAPEGLTCTLVGSTTVSGPIALDVYCLGAVTPTYSSSLEWNAFVNRADPSQSCSSNGNYYACIHLGEKRQIALPTASCDDVQLTDALDVFEWRCDDSQQPPRARSIGLKAGKGLTDLLAFTVSPATWRPNRLRVTLPSGTFESVGSVWWDNAIQVAPPASIATAGTVFVQEQDITRDFSLGSDTILVVAPGKKVTGEVSASFVSNVWLEGHFVGTGDSHGINMSGAYRMVLNRLTVSGFQDGINTSSQASSCLFRDLHLTANQRGLALYASQDDVFIRVAAMNNEDEGIHISYGMSDDLWLHTVVANNGDDGFAVDPFDAGGGTGNVLVNTITANNSGGGFLANNHPRMTVRGLTAVNNTNAGVDLGGLSTSDAYVLLENLLVTNNWGPGVAVSTGVQDSTVAHVMIDHNTSMGFSWNRSTSSAPAFVGTPLIVADNNAQCDISPSGSCTGVTQTAGVTDGGHWFAAPTDVATLDLSAALPFGQALGDPLSATFPSSQYGGHCTEGCGLWTFVPQGALVANVFTGPQAASYQRTHVWSDGTSTDHLALAWELLGDDVGNDDLLCEANEACVMERHLGGYQGRGEPKSPTDLATLGSFSGVTLYRLTD